VQQSVVDEHAAQFDDALADRPAGSQREFAAATYILGHLQRAGYVPLLDPVPVKDLIRSTNVVAAPPSAERPEVVVTVAYDTGPGAEPTGTSIGVWLELARALYARDRDHPVEFVALGAEHTRVNEGNLGSRRLVEFLREEDLSPLIVSLGDVSADGAEVTVGGDAASDLLVVADRLGVPTGAAGSLGPTDVVFRRAGLHDISIDGGAGDVGRVLLEFLAGGATPSPS
jgi:hypothetical protein